MAEVELKQVGGIAYREVAPETPASTHAVLCIHGYPESSLMWGDLLPPLGGAGHRAVAPDLPGYGNSPPIQEATWEHHVAAVEGFRRAVGLDRLVLVVHDWGGLIGMRWACDHPDAVAGMVLSNTGFFPDGKWHGMGKLLRTEGEGEAALEAMTREAFGDMLRASGRGFDEDDPDFSPNGRRVTYESFRDTDYEIFSAPADGGQEKPLTDNDADDEQPAYSPDGESIVFASNRGSGDSDIFRMDSNGGHASRVTQNNKAEESPDWGVR